ncbi:hypothetical protein Glove_330g47 [Diversispora epigaea]|uniref:Uncharacterized protein n=1 Tax=Diversispora epigaea TaxID=1348612 RepID=A0A397HRV3_9GLOM|nr:hypothetical protein Glove_330g47 [Diversispora epigaea]
MFPLFRQVVRFPQSRPAVFPKLLSTEITAKLASEITRNEVELLRVYFHPAFFEDVIPVTKDPELDKLSDNRAKTFLAKIHDVVMNEKTITGTRESKTDTLFVSLKTRNHPLCRLVIKEKPCISADPEFVISNRNLGMVAIEDKYIKNVYKSSGFGETQIAVQIIACGDENIRAPHVENYFDQTIYAMRVISSYVTFYKAFISAEYWAELGDAESSGRREVLNALIRIRHFLLRNEQSETGNKVTSSENEQ